MTPQKKRTLVALLGLAALAIVCQWWFFWPKRTLERFVGYVSRGELQEASALLDEVSSLELREDGAVEVLDRGGNAVTVPAGRLPFLASQTTSGEPGPRGLSDVLLARHRGAVTALGGGRAEPEDGPAVTLLLRAERGRIHIDGVE